MKMLLIGTLVDNANNIVGLRIADIDNIKASNYYKENIQPERLQVVNAPLAQVKIVLKQGHNIEGVEIDASGELKGTNGSFERYSKFNVNNMGCKENAVVILDKIEDKGFTVILASDIIRIFRSEDLIQSVLNGKTKIANGALKQKNNTNSKSNKASDYFISSIRGEYNTITEQDYIKKAGLRFTVEKALIHNEVEFNKEVKEAESKKSEINKANIEVQEISKEDLLLNNYRQVTEIQVPDEIMKIRDKHGMTIDEKITRAFSILRKKKPFYYYVLNQLKIKYVNAKENTGFTFSCTPIELFINPYTTINLPLPYILFTLMHEASHICMAHHERFKEDINHKVANLAMDLYVNEYLIDSLRLHRSGYYQKFLSLEELESLKDTKTLTELYNPSEVEERQIIEARALRDNIENYRDIRSTKLEVNRDFIAFNITLLSCPELDLKTDTVEDIYNEMMDNLVDNQQNQSENDNREEQEQNKQEQEGMSDNQNNNSDKAEDNKENSEDNKENSEDNKENSEDNKENSDSLSNNNNREADNSSNNTDNNNTNNQGNGQQNNDEQQDKESENLSSSSSNSEEQDEQNQGHKNNKGNQQGNKRTTSYKNLEFDLSEDKQKDISESKVLSEEEAIKNSGEQSFKGDDIIDSEQTANKNSEEKRLLNRTILRNAIEIFENSKEYGTTSGDAMYLIAKKVTAPKVRWQSVIAKFLTKASQVVYTYTAPDKRFLSRNMIMPGPRKMDPSALDDIAICIDTSGSISSKELGEALAQIKQLFRKYKATGNILYWDTNILSETKFKDINEILKSRPIGGGGTDANCIFEHFNTREYKTMRKKRPPLIIVFTDGYVSEINKKYAKDFKNTVWIVNEKGNKSFKAPFGIVAPFKNN